VRVQLRHRRRGEDGVVAVLVAILAVVLLVISAFVVDLGIAFTSKRQLQTAADAGALAAAKRFAEEPGTCPLLKASFSAEAEAVAESIATVNRPEQVKEDFAVDCLTSGPYKGALQVTYRASGTTPTYFGAGVVGDEISTDREASAVVYVPGKAKLRPYALCDLDIPPVSELPTEVREIKMPGQAWSGSDCAAAETGGNWWFVNCPGVSTMNAAEVATALKDGCENDAEVVEPQDPSSPTALSSSLTANCNDQSDVGPSCLDADTGESNLVVPVVAEAWEAILGETVLFPVFCTTSSVCSPSTVTGTGTNRVYPIFKLAPAVVCGYHILDKGSGSINTGDCAGNTFSADYADLLGCDNKNDACLTGVDPTTGAPTTQAPKETVRLFLKFVTDSDGVRGTTCTLGTACDAGLRQVTMSR
jgi:hypothetical protein